MKSLSFIKYGSLDDLQIKEIEMPAAGNGEVLVKIFASSINSWDWELLHARPFANRLMFGMFRPKKLKTLGIDIAGRVESIGSGVRQFKPGDEVYGDLSACGWGGFAEYVAVPEKALTRKPETISFEQAAAVPQAGLLALQGMVDMGHIHHGMKVLINGASGGSGSFALQIAKIYGAHVSGVCRTEKMAFVESLGADHVIDYTREDFTRNGQQYDLIIDAQAHHSLFDVRRALNANGVYVMHGGASSRIFQIMVAGPLLSLLGGRKLSILFHKANKGLDVMNDLLTSGKLVPVIDKSFPLTDVVDALCYYGEGKTKGKLVIRIEPNDS
jgi:NADPH:quinone reductase-like Zn-dependent oxidoreductase